MAWTRAGCSRPRWSTCRCAGAERGGREFLRTRAANVCQESRSAGPAGVFLIRMEQARRAGFYGMNIMPRGLFSVDHEILGQPASGRPSAAPTSRPERPGRGSLAPFPGRAPLYPGLGGNFERGAVGLQHWLRSRSSGCRQHERCFRDLLILGGTGISGKGNQALFVREGSLFPIGKKCSLSRKFCR